MTARLRFMKKIWPFARLEKKVVMSWETKTNAVIRAARMDSDDVYQQLCLRLILVAGRYDPEKSELSSYILRQLQYEFLTCKTSHMPCGIKNAPKELRDDSFVSLDAKDAGTYLDAAMAA